MYQKSIFTEKINGVMIMIRKLKSALSVLIGVVVLAGALPVIPAVEVSAASLCEIDVNTEYQTIDGFGGMNHPEWTGKDLTDAQRQKVFGNGDDELGFSVLRIFVNPDSNQWSKAVPTAKFAQEQGVKVFASPWEPPANLAESGGSNGKLHIPESNYAAYAKHLNDFGSYMKNHGVDLYAISIQNEPDFASEWTYWSTDEATNFLANYADKITSTRVMSPESFQYAPENASWVPDGGKKFYTKILNNAKAFANCGLFGIHFYGTQRAWMDFPALESCGKPIWMTEVYTDSKNDADVWPMALDVSENIHNGLVVGNMSAYVWWYIRRSYGPLKEDGTISKRGYCMAQYSKFVRPGDVRIGATEQPADNVYISAYKNDDNHVTIVAVNKGTEGYAQQFSIVAVAGTKIDGPSPISFNLGDINSDGIINCYDMILAKKGLLGGLSNNISALAADVNQDGEFNVADAVLIQKYILGMITEFPVEEKVIDTAALEAKFNGITLASSYKGDDENNPLISQYFGADPGTMEYNGRIYVYMTNDPLLTEVL